MPKGEKAESRMYGICTVVAGRITEEGKKDSR